MVGSKIVRAVGAFGVVCSLAGCGGSPRIKGVVIQQPAGTTYTNGTVHVVVEPQGGGPVVLRVDGSILTELAAAPFTYDWNTTALPEGPHALTASAHGFLTAPVTVVVDRTPPQVVLRDPAQGAADASVGDGIRVGFDEPILASSVGPESAVVVEGSGATLATGVSVDGSTLTLTPTGAEFPGTLTVTLSPPKGAAITDLAGNALATDVFSFRAPVWAMVGGAPPTPGHAAYEAAAAVDSLDRPVVAWVETTGDTSGLYVLRVRRFENGDWKSLGDVLNVSAGESAYVPQIVVDGSGAPVVAWWEAGSYGRVYVKRWNGASWESLGGALYATQGHSCVHPNLAVDAAGAPWVSFMEYDAATPTVYVMRWTGSSWSEVGLPLLDPGTDGGGGASLAVDAQGVPYFVLAEDDGSGNGHDVGVWRLIGSTFEPFGATLDVHRSDDAFASRLVLGSDGEPVVVWSETDPQARPSLFSMPAANVYAARFSASAHAWMRMGDALDYDVGAAAAYPQLLRAPSGELYASWMEDDGYGVTGWVSRWSGSDWRIVGSKLRHTPGRSVQVGPMAADSQSRVVIPLDEFENPDYDVSDVTVLRLNRGGDAPHGLASLAPRTGACALPAGAIPATLSATGCFFGFTPRVPGDQLIPYELNAPLWSDGALKKRWIVLPPGGTILYTEETAWIVPVGTILIKEFDQERVLGDATTRFPMETRFLVKRDATTVEGYSYKWRADLSDADLQPDVASTATYALLDGPTMVLDTHSLPSRTQCTSCHVAADGFFLGLQTPNMNRSIDYGDTVDNQLRALDHAGVFAPGTFPGGDPAARPRMPNPKEMAEPLELRFRAYAAGNCQQCHRANGSVPTKQFEWENTLAQTNVCNAIAIGSPSTSRLFQKLTSTPSSPPPSGSPMPPLARLTVDPVSSHVVGDWITSMTSCP